MTRPTLKPSEFACALADAPVGPFLYGGRIGLKTSLTRPNGTVLAYVGPGEEWTLGDDTVVQPIEPVWSDA